MLKTGQIFVPYETFAIIFSYECYIQTKTYQSQFWVCSKYQMLYMLQIYTELLIKIQEIKSYFSYGFEAIGEKHLISEVTLSFPEFVSVRKKSGYSITSCDNTGHT